MRKVGTHGQHVASLRQRKSGDERAPVTAFRLLDEPCAGAPGRPDGQPIRPLGHDDHLASDPQVGQDFLKLGPERRYLPGTTIVDLTDSIYEIGIGCAPRMVLTRPGYHVNDPSIVRRPRDGALLMYFTSANSATAWPNMLSMAISTDNGQTWMDQGDLGLGWTPSAVLVGDEIWVYSYVPPGTSDGRGAERHRFAASDGRTRLAPPDPVVVEGVPYVTSPAVATWRGKFLLAANGGDFVAVATAAAAQVIWLAESVDGLYFTRTQAIVRVEGSVTVGGAHITPLDEHHVSVLFGRAPHPLMPTGGTSVWEWTFRSVDAPGETATPPLESLGACPPASPPSTLPTFQTALSN
jgi:hypothetical protein